MQEGPPHRVHAMISINGQSSVDLVVFPSWTFDQEVLEF